MLGDVYLRTPSTQEEWKAVAKGFYENWNYPNCIGAVDGKHEVSSAVMIFVQRARSSTPYLWGVRASKDPLNTPLICNYLDEYLMLCSYLNLKMRVFVFSFS